MTEADAPLFPTSPRFIMPNWAFGKPMVRGRASRRWIEATRPIVAEAISDGIGHVAPILAVYRDRPAAVRKRIGKAAWKRIHHSAERHNICRAVILLHTPLNMDDVLRIPTGALSEALGMYQRHAQIFRLACGFATSRTTMREAIMLCADLRRMGGNINPAWSLNRLRREHDGAAKEWAHKKDAQDRIPWAEPWSIDLDGYTVTLLRSGADLRHEGRTMRHCVASYADRARAGYATIFRIDGAERATAEFSAGGMIQIQGRCNTGVRNATRGAAIRAWGLYCAHLRQSSNSPDPVSNSTTQEAESK